jgi:hypothetical protein
MRTETVTRSIFKFPELPDDVKARALDGLRDINVDHSDWYESEFDWFKDCAKALGIEIENIYFTGFWSQGDGAQFTGSYSYRKGWRKALSEVASDPALVSIGEALQTVQRRNFYQLSATVGTRGRYSHEMATSIDVTREDSWSALDLARDGDDDDVAEALRDFMRWIYRRLEAEYEYQTSDESIREIIECNEYEFDEEGNLA